MKFKMTKGMHAKRILCLGLAAAMAVTSVQVAPITVEAKTATAELTANHAGTDLELTSTNKANATEAYYKEAEVGTTKIDQIEKITIKAKNAGTDDAVVGVKVYLKLVDETTFSDTSFVQMATGTNDAAVYNGEITVPKNTTDYKNFELTLPKKFEVGKQNKNLLVAVETTLKSGSQATIKTYKTASDASDKVAVTKTDEAAVDLTQEGVSGTQAPYRPSLTLTAHTHTVTKVEAKAVTEEDGVISDGWANYYICDGSVDLDACSKVYKESACTQETTLDKLKFEAYRTYFADKLGKLITDKYGSVDSGNDSEVNAVKGVTYSENKNLAENKAAVDAEYKKQIDTLAVALFANVASDINIATDADVASEPIRQKITDASKVYQELTTAQKAKVGANLKAKYQTAVKLKNDVVALENAIKAIGSANDIAIQDAYKTTGTKSKVAAIKVANEARKTLEDDIKENYNKNGLTLKAGITYDGNAFSDSSVTSTNTSGQTDEHLVEGYSILKESYAVLEVIEAIDAIKTPITLESGAAIKAILGVEGSPAGSNPSSGKYNALSGNVTGASSSVTLKSLVYNIDKFKNGDKTGTWDKYCELIKTSSETVALFNALDAFTEAEGREKINEDTDLDDIDAAMKALIEEQEQYDTFVSTYPNQLKKYNVLKKAMTAFKAIEEVTEVLEKDDAKVAAARKALNDTTYKTASGLYAKDYVDDDSIKLLEKAEEAVDVINKIKAIGTVGKDSEAKIKAAREAFDEINAKDIAEYVETTHTTYDRCAFVGGVPARGGNHVIPSTGATGTYKILVDAENSFAVVNVIEAIKAIGTVEYTDECRAKIDDAIKAYNSLTNDDQKKAVTNYSDLEAALVAYDEAGQKKEDTKQVNLFVSLVNALKEHFLTAKDADHVRDLQYTYDASGLVGEEYNGTPTPTMKLSNAQVTAVPTQTVGDLADARKAVSFAKDVAAIDELDGPALTGIPAHKVNYNNVAATITPDPAKALSASQRAMLGDDVFKVIDAALDVYGKIVAVKEAGQLTMENQSVVTEARAAYDAYYATYKDADNFVKITAADYKVLTDAEETLVTVRTVDLVKKIRAIADAKTAEETKTLTETAQAAFDALTVEEKSNFILNYAEDYAKLIEAGKAYDATIAAEMDTKIAALPDATLENEEAINTVYAEFDALTVARKDLVKNASVLKEKVAAIAALKTAKADKEAADAAAKVIDAIGTVDGTDATDAKINAALTAYYELTDAQQKLIADRKTVLDKAVQDQADKKAEILAEQVKKEDAEKAEAAQKEEDAKAVAAAKEAIAAIGTVTKADEATKIKITKAQVAFYGLSEALQATLKDEKAVLDAANEKYTELYIQDKVNDKLEEISASQPKATATPEPTATTAPTATPEPTATTAPTATATPEPTATTAPTATATPEPTATTAPTATATPEPTATTTPKPTATSTPKPTATPKVTKPAKVTNVKVVNKKTKKAVVSWKKIPKVAGYQVQISTSKKFTKSTTKTYKITKATTVKKTVSKLSLKKKYYVRVRAYNKSGSTVKYGNYSTVKSVTIKK